MNKKMIKNLSNKELSKIIRDSNSSEEDIIMASIEKGERDYKDGKVYTTEEVRKILFGERLNYLENQNWKFEVIMKK